MGARADALRARIRASSEARKRKAIQSASQNPPASDDVQRLGEEDFATNETKRPRLDIDKVAPAVLAPRLQHRDEHGGTRTLFSALIGLTQDKIEKHSDHATETQVDPVDLAPTRSITRDESSENITSGLADSPIVVSTAPAIVSRTTTKKGIRRLKSSRLEQDLSDIMTGVSSLKLTDGKSIACNITDNTISSIDGTYIFGPDLPFWSVMVRRCESKGPPYYCVKGSYTIGVFQTYDEARVFTDKMPNAIHSSQKDFSRLLAYADSRCTTKVPVSILVTDTSDDSDGAEA
jgi:hypothetical protein